MTVDLRGTRVPLTCATGGLDRGTSTAMYERERQCHTWSTLTATDRH